VNAGRTPRELLGSCSERRFVPVFVRIGGKRAAWLIRPSACAPAHLHPSQGAIQIPTLWVPGSLDTPHIGIWWKKAGLRGS
jgi:hypothetical protein